MALTFAAFSEFCCVFVANSICVPFMGEILKVVDTKSKAEAGKGRI
jgi:hypothetical protein